MGAIGRTVISVFFVALVAGCAGARNSTPPLDAAAPQAAPDLQSGVPAQTLSDEIARRSLAPRHFAPDGKGKVRIWATNVDYGYLLGQDSSGSKTIKAIDVTSNGCYDPIAVKVDHKRNVWIACELAAIGGTVGAVQEYSHGGLLENQYLPACPSNVSNCQSFSGYGFDSALDHSGHVFAALNNYQMQCSPSCTQTAGSGFEWWPNGSPSTAPVLISLAQCSPVCYVGFMDVDSSGNLWFTFAGYNQFNQGFGLAEVTNPTTNPQLSVVEAVGNYSFYGGVYASNHGNTLNVVNQNVRMIYQYHLPLSPSGAPFNELGPTPEGKYGGTPVSGGFNKKDTRIAIGDENGWLDLGKVSTNTWSLVENSNFAGGLDGAAYTPSDK